MAFEYIINRRTTPYVQEFEAPFELLVTGVVHKMTLAMDWRSKHEPQLALQALNETQLALDVLYTRLYDEAMGHR